jgi:CheY-like chemotaxis protein
MLALLSSIREDDLGGLQGRLNDIFLMNRAMMCPCPAQCRRVSTLFQRSPGDGETQRWAVIVSPQKVEGGTPMASRVVRVTTTPAILEEKMSEEHSPRKTILFVEDDAEIGSLFFQVLVEETTYEVVLATHPLEALSIVKDLTPVLFILNYQLPVMDGLQLWDQLHAQRGLEQIPTLMISATLPQQQALDSRGIIALEKPVDLDTFLATIHTLIE